MEMAVNGCKCWSLICTTVESVYSCKDGVNASNCLVITLKNSDT
jgi:hypothetical protein